VHYSIFDSTVEKYMVTCSRYMVASIFESVVVVAEVYEYPDLLLSMGILPPSLISLLYSEPASPLEEQEGHDAVTAMVILQVNHALVISELSSSLCT
jgi:hypothetical protein